ncbi:MAG: (Fe-S)-binding protein [Archaeoglobus sp.]|nr:(Fe-S)-binding protein [Archaeoglobus sp.]
MPPIPVKWVLQATSSSTLKTKLSFLKEALTKAGRVDDIKKCMLCPNMCLHVCPVFDVERRLTVSPSVKSRLAYFSSAGEKLGDAIWRCVPCNACKQACPMDISVNEILIDERSKVCELDEEPEAVKLAFVSHESLVKDLEKNFGERYEIKEGKVLYFPGCRTFEVPEVIHASLKILEYFKVDFAFQNVICCGAHLKELGYLRQFKEHKARIWEIVKNYEGIISNCPHCVKIFNEKYNMKAIHFSQFLEGKLGELEKLGLKLNSSTASYHDPCILSRDLKVIDGPRRILKAVGVEVKEVGYGKEKTYCCGFGGIYAYIDPVVASKMAEERRKQLLEASDTIITSCPVCKRALNAKDVVEVVAELL